MFALPIDLETIAAVITRCDLGPVVAGVVMAVADAERLLEEALKEHKVRARPREELLYVLLAARCVRDARKDIEIVAGKQKRRIDIACNSETSRSSLSLVPSLVENDLLS